MFQNRKISSNYTTTIRTLKKNYRIKTIIHTVELESTLSRTLRCLATQLQRHRWKSRVLFVLNHYSEQCPAKNTSVQFFSIVN
ncbi:Nif-specific regulatory protein [Trichinella spiralis]|uniref:Nif-specific regulatory protein n=1 Tax=Trichinella spiralis TaxID=6334 RepID=A0ABR3KAE5_TRISP